jgi:hypothetical protein
MQDDFYEIVESELLLRIDGSGKRFDLIQQIIDMHLAEVNLASAR